MLIVSVCLLIVINLNHLVLENKLNSKLSGYPLNAQQKAPNCIGLLTYNHRVHKFDLCTNSNNDEVRYL